MGRRGVPHSAELERIKALPRRDWEASEENADLTAGLTDFLKTRRGDQTLRPFQAQSLQEISEFSGALIPESVGGGKTLVALLAAVAAEAKRPLLLMPAKLLRKTQAELETYAQNWRIAWPELLSYERLSRVSRLEQDEGITLLDEYAPDLIIADECHRIKNPKAACTKKVKRYFKKNPHVGFVGLSGTLFGRSLRDFAHLAEWALRDRSPLPRVFTTLEDWASAVDERTYPGDSLAPGALADLCTVEEIQDGLPGLRRAIQRRILDTPGVIATRRGGAGECTASLILESYDVPMGDQTEEAFRRLLEDWETPDGHPISDPPTLWRHQREVAAGFFYRWDPRAPRDWLQARKDWAAFVREKLAHSQTLHSENAVALAVVSGKVKDPGGYYETWAAIRKTFVPNSVPVWLDYAFLEWVEKWAKKNRGIIFVEHRAIGQALAERLEIPYFAQNGLDVAGRRSGLIDHTTPKDGPILASLKSNLEGRNLQAWDRALVTAPLTTGRDWEQLLGRLHRSGQRADEICYDVVINCYQHQKAMSQSISDARAQQDVLGSLKKLTIADKLLDLETRRGAFVPWRWREKAKGI